jgi:hypothetical protein
VKRILAFSSLGLLTLPAVLFGLSFLDPMSVRCPVAPYLAYECGVGRGCFFSLKLVGPAAQAPQSEIEGCARPVQPFGIAPRYIHCDFSEDCLDYPPGYQVGAILSAVYPGGWLAVADCVGMALMTGALLRRRISGRRGFAVSFAAESASSPAISSLPAALARPAERSSF